MKIERVKYQTEEVGMIKRGPTRSVKFNVVSYRDEEQKIHKHLDIRMYSYTVKTARYYASSKGITLPLGLCKHLFNYIGNLPTDMEYPEERTEIKRWPKNNEEDVVLQVNKYQNHKNIDIRTWVKKSANNYVGFSFKGVAFSMDLRDDFLKLLEASIYKLDEGHEENNVHTAKLDVKY